MRKVGKGILSCLIILIMSGITIEVLLQGDANTDWMEVLKAQLEDTEQYISQHEHKDEAISKVDIGWHLTHTLLVIIEVYKVMQQSQPEAYSWSFNVMRSTMLLTSRIPRGRADATEVVIPKRAITALSIQQQLAEARKILSKIKELPMKANFEHPIVGQLHRDQAIQFLQIHTKHHLAIIEDILKSFNAFTSFVFKSPF